MRAILATPFFLLAGMAGLLAAAQVPLALAAIVFDGADLIAVVPLVVLNAAVWGFISFLLLAAGTVVKG